MWARHSRAQQRAADPMTPRRGPEAGTNCKRQPRSPAAHRLKTAAEGHSTHQHSLTGRPSLTHGVPPLLLGHEQCSVIHKLKPPRTPGAGPRTGTALASAARTTCGGWPPTTTHWQRSRKSSPAQPMPRPSTASICPTPGSSNFGGWWGSGLRRWPPLPSDRPNPVVQQAHRILPSGLSIVTGRIGCTQGTGLRVAPGRGGLANFSPSRSPTQRAPWQNFAPGPCAPPPVTRSRSCCQKGKKNGCHRRTGIK